MFKVRCFGTFFASKKGFSGNFLILSMVFKFHRLIRKGLHRFWTKRTAIVRNGLFVSVERGFCLEQKKFGLDNWGAFGEGGKRGGVLF